MDRTIKEYFDFNPWFRRLNQAQLDALLAIAQEVSWSDGTIIFREGQVDRNLYLIVSGRVAPENCQSKAVKRREPILVAVRQTSCHRSGSPVVQTGV